MRLVVTENYFRFLRESSVHLQTFLRKNIGQDLLLRNIAKRSLHARQEVAKMGHLQMVKKLNNNSRACICLCGRRYTSDIKNDEMVKAWLSEIRADFAKKETTKAHSGEINKVNENVTEKIAENSDSPSKNPDKSESSVGDEKNKTSDSAINEHVEPEIHGYTTEEMIELVKQSASQTSNNPDEKAADNSDDLALDSSSSSDSDNGNGSSSSSESDEEPEVGKKGSNSKAYQTGDKHLQAEVNDSEIIWDEVKIATATDRLKKEVAKAARKNKDVRSIQERFKNASDYVKSEIEDFVNISYEEPEEEVRLWEPPVELTRGQTGVFDIEELVTVLESTRARDIVVMKIPEEIDFANYMVIVTALSYRHIKAITADIRWIYKRKKSRRDNIIKVEGEDTKDWFAFDLGNIILHVFTEETRVKYDLETLWTVGPKFDPKCQQEVKAPLFTMSDLPWLEELEQQVAPKEAETSQAESRALPKKGRKTVNREPNLQT